MAQRKLYREIFEGNSKEVIGNKIKGQFVFCDGKLKMQNANLKISV